MKTFIVYDDRGVEKGMFLSTNHNAAEKSVQAKYGRMASVAYTEVSEEEEAKLSKKVP